MVGGRDREEWLVGGTERSGWWEGQRGVVGGRGREEWLAGGTERRSWWEGQRRTYSSWEGREQWSRGVVAGKRY